MMSCGVFLSLYAFGSVMCSLSMSDKNLANFYVGAFLQFTTGLIGCSGLWMLMSPRILGSNLSFLFCVVNLLRIYIHLGIT
jgi:hypothetical protein